MSYVTDDYFECYDDRGDFDGVVSACNSDHVELLSKSRGLTFSASKYRLRDGLDDEMIRALVKDVGLVTNFSISVGNDGSMVANIEMILSSDAFGSVGGAAKPLSL